MRTTSMLGVLALAALAALARDASAKDWTAHTGKIPFLIGREAGLKEAKFTGRPVMYFYTATW